MIKFSDILKREAITKVKAAKIMGIEQTNVNRTFERFEKNISEIDMFLKKLNTSLESELCEFSGCTKKNNALSSQHEGYLNIPVAIFDVIAKHTDTIISQQKTIERLTMHGLSKKAKTA